MENSSVDIELQNALRFAHAGWNDALNCMGVLENENKMLGLRLKAVELERDLLFRQIRELQQMLAQKENESITQLQKLASVVNNISLDQESIQTKVEGSIESQVNMLSDQIQWLFTKRKSRIARDTRMAENSPVPGLLTPSPNPGYETPNVIDNSTLVSILPPPPPSDISQQPSNPLGPAGAIDTCVREIISVANGDPAKDDASSTQKKWKKSVKPASKCDVDGDPLDKSTRTSPSVKLKKSKAKSSVTALNGDTVGTNSESRKPRR